MNRRKFLGAVAATSLSIPLTARAGAAQTSVALPRRTMIPNIVIFLADDLSLVDVGCYGGQAPTPNFDRLAREGMRFDGVFTTEAMCAPARSSLYTGLYPFRHGCHMNHGSVKAGVRSLPHYLRPLGYRVALAGKTHIKPWENFPFEAVGRLSSNQGPELEKVDEFLAQAKTVGQPFCLVVASHEPHVMAAPPDLQNTTEASKQQQSYYQHVAAWDTEMGTVLDSLKRHGLDENTLIIATADHGAGMYAKWTLYDLGLRVPMVVRWPGVVAAGTRNDAMISFVDVVPTLVEVAGGTPPSPQVVDGRSFGPVLREGKNSHHDIIFGAHTTMGIIGGTTYPIRAARTATHKYIRNLAPQNAFENTITRGDGAKQPPMKVWTSWLDKAQTDPHTARRVHGFRFRPAEELYDIRSDPNERLNLAADAAHAATLAKLRRQLDAWMTQQGDTGLAAELAVKPMGFAE